MTNKEIKAYKGNPAGTIFGLMEHIRPKKCKMVNGGNRMTPQEALNHFEEYVCKHCCEWDKSLRHCNTCPTDTAKKALKKADKYRWHDLRKNPDDLPEAIGGGYESDYVLVMIGTPEWNSWEQAYYHHGKRLWSTYEQNVFAWRYIEPFKEEE